MPLWDPLRDHPKGNPSWGNPLGDQPPEDTHAGHQSRNTRRGHPQRTRARNTARGDHKGTPPVNTTGVNARGNPKREHQRVTNKGEKRRWDDDRRQAPRTINGEKLRGRDPGTGDRTPPTGEHTRGENIRGQPRGELFAGIQPVGNSGGKTLGDHTWSNNTGGQQNGDKPGNQPGETTGGTTREQPKGHKRGAHWWSPWGTNTKDKRCPQKGRNPRGDTQRVKPRGVQKEGCQRESWKKVDQVRSTKGVPQGRSAKGVRQRQSHKGVPQRGSPKCGPKRGSHRGSNIRNHREVVTKECPTGEVEKGRPTRGLNKRGQ